MLKNMVQSCWLFFAFAVLIGCQSQPPTLTEQSEYEDNLPNYIEVENFSVEMNGFVEATTSPVEKIILKIKNLGTENVGFGEYYQIEKRQGNTWYRIPFKENIEFIEIGYFIEPGITEEMIILMNNLDFQLTEGEYRIVKDFWTDEGVPHTLSSEFNIK